MSLDSNQSLVGACTCVHQLIAVQAHADAKAAKHLRRECRARIRNAADEILKAQRVLADQLQHCSNLLRDSDSD